MEIEQKIIDLANSYSAKLDQQVLKRIKEMKNDNKSHYLIYRALRITMEEGEAIDIYQNKGRFLYKYAGSFLEEATMLCFEHKYGERAEKNVRIPNTIGERPKTFEIDCLVGQDAYEIKWRDATTDGDHIMKEHTRMQAIKDKGYTPHRLMFYYPNRRQAIRIQQTLKTLYNGVDGQYFHGDAAWDFVYKETGVDLKGIISKIAEENSR
ncbi:ApaLI family restriction endonuclease [Lentibacillus salicampi]|uniref:ApaLI family restriction endonuclease n=1 Tax=Lentibacillus salicampi TaxID=175306 RepID=A0A4Y9AAE8_9BACI|nr:ApaLI family restriction endonuclease [Lentibacillus salicampi]TFJ92753.1 ApaLI family restriction endonuclease [Lentibacillus salicampi]